jgi:hypothetical protein
VPFAPITWNAGREPSGRIGNTLAEVCTSSRRTSIEVSIPSASSRPTSIRPTASVPIAPAHRTSAPSFAIVTAVPPAAPAAVIRISSTSSPP